MWEHDMLIQLWRSNKRLLRLLRTRCIIMRILLGQKLHELRKEVRLEKYCLSKADLTFNLTDGLLLDSFTDLVAFCFGEGCLSERISMATVVSLRLS